MPSTNKSIAVNQYRTHNCGELSIKNIDKKVTLSGWVQTRRDHGGLIFIDLRDKWGITQLTFNPGKNEQAFNEADRLRSEFVITATGTVKKRPADMINPKLNTGEIEIEVNHLTVQSSSKTPPFPVASDTDIGEDIRLKYRFIDLRHPRLQKMLKKRDEFISYIRQYMSKQGFTEVQTPILANSSPEGARDYLVPSRIYPGQFYALPQAPQQFKQLLMVGGLDRYFQIAPCFRDEDPRADRHAGAFYQIDLEMSFVEQEDIFNVIEPLMIKLTDRFSRKKVSQDPFPRIPWRTSMTKYGTDKPDLRFDLFISEITDLVSASDFKIFTDAIANQGVVHALHIPSGANFSRRDIDELTDKAKQNGVAGLAYLLMKENASSPLAKYLDRQTIDNIIRHVGAAPGDALFFAADQWSNVCQSLGAVRNLAADKLKLKDDSQAAWAWITDFPMYEYNTDTGQIDFSHNPFSMPQGGMKALEETEDPTTILGYQYDLAVNGYEISSGAIRNHRPDIMYKAFALAGYSKKEVDDKFGGMIRAFEYGAPPHGGFAPGLDRLFMVLNDEPNIREIYAFPKDNKARDLMMNAPSPVSDKQLRELKLKIDLDE